MKRRTFIKSSLLAGGAFTLSCADIDCLDAESNTTLVGIGGAGVTIVNKAMKTYKEKVTCVGIDTKGHWNTSGHDLIHIDYNRPAFSMPGTEFVQFYTGSEFVEECWANNYSKLEPVFETAGKVIVVTGIKGTMGGIVGHKIIREIAKRRNSQITFIAVGPFSFEGSKAVSNKQYALVKETGKLCSHLEIISNTDLINGHRNNTLFKLFSIADQKIVERIGQLI